MKVALIGASGFVGTALLNELVARGHTITAIVRNPEKVKEQQGVSVVQADILDITKTADILKGHDAVVSAYNAGWTNPNLYNDFLEGSKAIQTAVKSAGVKRLIVIGGAGSLYMPDGKQLVDSEQFPADIKSGALAARDYLDVLKTDTELDWTFFSPAIEMHPGTSGERKGHYRTSLDHPVFDENNRSVLSVEDLAMAIVDELENPKYIRKRFTAAY